MLIRHFVKIMSRTSYLIFSLGLLVSITSGQPLDEKVQQLTEKLNEIKETLSERVTQLETRNGQLEGKVTQLEAKIQHQESLITSLNNRFDSSASSNADIVTNNQLLLAGREAIPRTCRDIRSSNPSFASGMYWIDPDGQGVGDDPIYVYCNMTSGTTSILHDSERPMDVGHCLDPGCYSRTVNYNATLRQMEALAAVSLECHQSITYDCNYAPFEFDNIAFSWWNDKDGNAKFFWSGDNTDAHTCQCGIDGNCIENYLKCFCDSAAPVQLADRGVITDKSVLPITRLNFGRTLVNYSSGVHTLGRFECGGQVAVEGFPSSCEDLWRIGHTLSGLYSVMGDEMVESVYCDFTKLPYDPSFEKWIGYVDVKSTPTHFYVQKETNFSTKGTPIPFEIEKLNIGGAMNLSSGIFTAPRPGTYFFSFIGAAMFSPSSTSLAPLGVGLFLNGTQVGLGYVQEQNTATSGQWHPFSVHSTLHLKAGDEISLQITFSDAKSLLNDSINHHNHFTGWLVKEDIAHSL